MNTRVDLSIAARRAIKHFNAHKGSLRTNSHHYRDVIGIIAQAENPEAEANRQLRALNSEKQREKQGNLEALAKTLYSEERRVSTYVLDGIIAEIRKGFPGGRLDPMHVSAIERFEAEVFDGKATLDGLRRLIKRLTSMAVYDPRRNAWSSYKPR